MNSLDLGLHRGHIGMMAQKMENAIQHSGFEV